MSDEVGKRLATLGALLELKEALAQGDLKAAQACRDKRLILALICLLGIGNDMTHFNNSSMRAGDGCAAVATPTKCGKHSNARSHFLSIEVSGSTEPRGVGFPAYPL